MNDHFFGKTEDGSPVAKYTLKSEHLSIDVLTYGAVLRAILVGGRDIIGGYDTLDGYLLDDDPYQGACIGRVGNRIKEGRFTIGDKEYRLSINNGRHHLHGGIKGFNRHIFNVEEVDDSHITLSRVSPDGEEGYPANLSVRVTYSVIDDCLKIAYDATADGDTPVNLTNHAFYNLNGLGAGTIFDHTVMINADRYTEIDDEMIPTGNRPSVAGTPFDFRTPKPVRRDLSPALTGYDHNFILSETKAVPIADTALPHAATIWGDDLMMEVYTTAPCAQFYTGNFLGGDLCFKDGVPKTKNHLFCFETQIEPDGIHNGTPPLRKGEHFRSVTVYRFRPIKE